MIRMPTTITRTRKKVALDCTAPAVAELKATSPGFIAHCDARLIGETIRDLGGGRLTKGSAINYDGGVDGLARPVEKVEAGALLCRIHARNDAEAGAARIRLAKAFTISKRPPAPADLIAGIICS